MLKSHYTAIDQKLSDKVTEVSVNDYEIPDIFAEDW